MQFARLIKASSWMSDQGLSPVYTFTIFGYGAATIGHDL